MHMKSCILRNTHVLWFQVLHSFDCAVILDVYGVCIPNIILCLLKGLEFSAHGLDDCNPDGTAVNAGQTAHLGLYLEE